MMPILMVQTTSALTRIDGLVLISFFVIFMYYIFGLAKSGDSTESAKDEESSEKVVSVSRSLLMVVEANRSSGGWKMDCGWSDRFATNLSEA